MPSNPSTEINLRSNPPTKINLFNVDFTDRDRARASFGPPRLNLKLPGFIWDFLPNGNDLMEETSIAVAQALRSFIYLECIILNLALNDFSDTCIRHLSENLMQRQRAHHLSLGWGSIDVTEHGVVEFGNCLLNLPQLTKLQFYLPSEFELEFACARALSRGLRIVSGLQALKLAVASCNIDDHYIAELSQGLAHLSQLNTINLNFNQTNVGAQGIQALTAALSILSRLIDARLSFEHNTMDVASLGCLASWIVCSHELRRVLVNLSMCALEIDTIHTFQMSSGASSLEVFGTPKHVAFTTEVVPELNFKLQNIDFSDGDRARASF